MIYLDTHVVVWLYAGLSEKFTDRGIDLLENRQLFISPMVQLELQYLKEIQRITVDSALMIETLAYSIGLQTCQTSFAQIIAESITETWTRDPFDRLIVAQAKTRKAPLLTQDRLILEHYPQAVW